MSKKQADVEAQRLSDLIASEVRSGDRVVLLVVRNGNLDNMEIGTVIGKASVSGRAAVKAKASAGAIRPKTVFGKL